MSMFRGLKSKLEKSLNQSNIRASFSKSNQGDDSIGSTSSHQQGDETPIGGSRRSSASTSLVDLSEDPTNIKAETYFFNQSTPISSDGHRMAPVDHSSPAILDLSNFESTDDFTNANSNQQKPTRPTAQRSDNSNNNAVQVGRSRNSSVSSQMSDSYYFTPNSGFVPQPATHPIPHHGMMSDVESVTSEFDDSSSVTSTHVVDDRMMDLVSREELMRFYKKMQAKNQKYTGRYSQVVAAYRELEKERDRLKEVLTKCQDKSFQRVNELKEQLGLKDMALKDVEVNYTMMLQEKDEFIKVLQMQVNILKQKFDSEKLIDFGGEGTKKESRKASKGDDNDDSNVTILLEENSVLKEKVSKMSGLLSNCKASILKHREEIQELQSENFAFRQKIDVDQSELNSLRSQVNDLAAALEQSQHQDSNGLRLVQDLSSLQAEHEALVRVAEETKEERNVLASKLRDAAEMKTDLEARLEVLEEENVKLRKRSEEMSGRLKDEIDSRIGSEKICSEKETRWRQKIADILRGNTDNQFIHGNTDNQFIHGNTNNSNQSFASHDNVSIARVEESDDNPESSRSESWTTDGSSLSDSIATGFTQDGGDDDDDEKWKDLERKLKMYLEGRRVQNSSRSNANWEDALKSYKSKLESVSREKTDLKKSLSSAKMQARVFRNLCECIFKAVVLKKAESKVVASNPVAADLNSNFNNNANGSDASDATSDAVSPSATSIRDDLFLNQESNPLKVTRSMTSQEDQSDLQDFSVRNSILAILKDGLGQTMKMMEERKKRKGGDFYRLSTAEDLAGGENKNVNNSTLGRTGSDSCLKLDEHPPSSTPIADRTEDDEDWETVDEDDDGSAGYIEDYENLFLSGERLKNSSIQKLLMNWKVGCEKFERAVSEKSRPQNIFSSSLHPPPPPLGVSMKSEVSCQTGSAPVASSEDFENLRTSYDKLKSEQEHLLENYNHLQLCLSSKNQSLDELKETNRSISESFESLENEFKRKSDDSQSKEKYLENAEKVNSELQQSFYSFREDHLQIQQHLTDVTAENVRLTNEISEGNEHFSQIQNDLMTSEVRCTELREELHRSQLDKNIVKQDYSELKDEHEKMIEGLNACEENLKKTKENLSKLQSEHLLLQEESKILIEEGKRRKVVESDLRKEVDDLRISTTQFEEIRGKLQTSLDKTRHEAFDLSSELEERRKVADKLVDDLKQIEDQNERLKVDKEESSKLLKDLKIELATSRESCDALKNEVENMKEELEKENRERCSSDSLQSNLAKTRNELAAVKEEFDKVQIQLEFLKGNLDKSLDDNSTLEEKLQTVTEARDDLEEKCSSFESDLKDEERKMEELKIIRSDLEVRISSEESSRFEAEKLFQANVDEMKLQLEQTQSTIKDLQNLMNDKDGEISKLETELNELNRKLNVSQSTNDELVQKHSDLLSSNELDLRDVQSKHSRELQNLNENLESSQLEINKLTEKLESLNKELEKQKAEEAETKMVMIGMKEEIEKKEEELKSTKELFERERIEYEKINLEKSASLAADLNHRMTSLEEEKLTNEKQACQLKQLLEESQRQIDLLKDTNNNLNRELLELKSSSDSSALKLTQELELKTQSISDSWMSKLSNLEASKNDEISKIKEEFEEKQIQNSTLQAKLEEEISRLENEISISNEKVDNLRTDLKSLRERFDEVVKSEASSKSKTSELENNLDSQLCRFKNREEDYNTWIERLKREVEDKEAFHASLRGKLEDENVKLKSKIEISREKLDDLTAEVNSLQIKLKEATNSEDCLKSRITELEESLTQGEESSKSKESAFEEEIVRLKQLASQSVRDVDKVSEENLKNLKILIDVRTEKEELEKCFENLKQEKNILEIERNNLKEQLKKSEESLELLELTRSSECKSFESKLAEVVSERDKLMMEVDRIAGDHQTSSEGKQKLIDEMDLERIEEVSNMENFTEEKVLLQNYVDEQNVKRIKFKDEIKKMSRTDLEKLVKEFDQKIAQMKEPSDIRINDIRFESGRIASEERQKLEREISILKESIAEMNAKIEGLNDALKNKELELSNKTAELKKKAEIKFKQLKKQKDDAVQACDEKISELEKQVSELKDELVKKDVDVENLKRSNLEEVNKLKELLEEETSIVLAQTNDIQELMMSLAHIKTSLDDQQSTLEDTRSQLEDTKSHLQDAQSKLYNSNEALTVTNKEMENLKSEINFLTNDRANSKKDLEEATKKIKLLDRELDFLRTSSEQEKSSSTQSTEKLESLEKKLSEMESESETVKRKNQSLRQEVRRLKTENETNLKAAELDKVAEIGRLKQEYGDELNERDEDHSSKIKHLLKEFQVQMAEKEMEYQDQFISSIEKIENENNLRSLDLETELRDLREELREKEELVEERCVKIDELMLQISRLKSIEEWEDLLEKIKELEFQNQELQKRLDDEECRKMDYEDVLAPNKQSQLNGSQISLVSSESSIVPMEFEYLKTVLFKFMIGSADKQTLTKVICKVMKFTEAEENKVMEPWRK